MLDRKQFVKKGAKRFNELALSKPLASTINNPLLGFAPIWGGTVRLTPQDQLLVQAGGGGIRALDVYYDLLVDPHVFATLDKVLQEICSRDWHVKPADDSEKAKEIADWCDNMLSNLGMGGQESANGRQIATTHAGGFDSLTKALGLAYIIGFQPAEIIWGFDKEGLIEPKSVLPKDARRFVFEGDAGGLVYPKLLLTTNSYDGIYLPPRKFILHTFWSIASDDAYGLGIGQQLYYLVQWKRQAYTYWLTMIDRFVEPIAIGKAPAIATDEQIEAFKDFLVGIAKETSAVLPDGFELEFKNAGIQGATEMLMQLIEQLDSAISLAVLGEAVTGEQIGNGLGGAKELISNSIRIMKAKAISDGISTTINNSLLKWAVEFRWGKDAPVPSVWRSFEQKEDINEFLNHMQILQALEYPISFKHIEETTGYPMDEAKKAVADKQLARAQKLANLPTLEDAIAQQQNLLK